MVGPAGESGKPHHEGLCCQGDPLHQIFVFFTQISEGVLIHLCSRFLKKWQSPKLLCYNNLSSSQKSAYYHSSMFGGSTNSVTTKFATSTTSIKQTIVWV